MAWTRGDTIINELNLAQTVSAEVLLDRIDHLALHLNHVDATPGAKTFDPADVSIATDRISIPAHGFSTGLKLQFSSSGALPAGLLVSTDYFVIKVDDDMFKVAASLADAITGGAIDLNSQGTGIHTATPSAFAGGTFKFYSSNDIDKGFAEIPQMRITLSAATGTCMANVVHPTYRWLRVEFNPSAGSIDLEVILNARQDDAY